MNSIPQNFLEKLSEIKELYIEVKEVIILAENFDPIHDVYLSPLNELRNSYDHIIRSLIYTDKVDIELDEAKEHLYRAGYDAYEVLAINIGDRIIKIVEKFDASIISTVFPTYYTIIKPALIDIKTELADVRAHKRLNPETGTKSFTPYKEKITNLIKQLKITESNIPSLLSEKKKRRNKVRIREIIAVIIGLAIAMVGHYLYDKILNRAESTTPEIKQMQPKSDSSK